MLNDIKTKHETSYPSEGITLNMEIDVIDCEQLDTRVEI